MKFNYLKLIRLYKRQSYYTKIYELLYCMATFINVNRVAKSINKRLKYVDVKDRNNKEQFSSFILNIYSGNWEAF